MSEIVIRRGDTWSRQSTFTLATGTIAGSKLWMTIKRKESDPDSQALAQIVSDGLAPGIVIDDFTHATFTLSPAQTALLPLTSKVPLYFDVQIKLPSGAIHTTDSGEVTVLPDITRATD